MESRHISEPGFSAHEQSDSLVDTHALDQEQTIAETRPRKIIGDFEITRELSRSGMGAVYEA